jgi:hypothetical protein
MASWTLGEPWLGKELAWLRREFHKRINVEAIGDDSMASIVERISKRNDTGQGHWLGLSKIDLIGYRVRRKN